MPEKKAGRGGHILEEIVEAPAVALEKTVEASHHITENLVAQSQIKKAGEYWRILGPGLTTGAADDDPSGITTYSQTGAQYGFQLLWLAPLTFPLMAIVQEMCARIGIVTGRGLAWNIRQRYPARIIQACTVLLLLANTFNIGADLGAMAKATQLLLPNANFALLVVAFAAVSLGLQVFTAYERYARYLKWLAMILFSYVFAALLAHLNWREVGLAAVTPHIGWSKDEIVLICAILGTTISPYLFFWQTSQEVEQQILDGKTTVQERKDETSPEDVRRMRIDVWSGMLLSNLVMFFIIAACAAVLYGQSGTVITTAADAAEALRPLAGNISYLLFAAGIIGTGLLAIPVLAGSTSYAVAESMHWRMGLYRSLNQARAFYGVIILSMLLGVGLNFVGLDPIKALIYSAVLNGLVAPVVLALIVSLASSRAVMGDWVNARSTTWLGWIITGVMVVAGIAAVASLAL